jgi:hypothetical protein
MPTVSGALSKDAQLRHDQFLRLAVDHVGAAVKAASDLHQGITTLHSLASRPEAVSTGIVHNSGLAEGEQSKHVHQLLEMIERSGRNVDAATSTSSESWAINRLPASTSTEVVGPQRFRIA